MKILKYTGIILLTYGFLCLSTPFIGFLKNRSIRNQINYLSSIIDEGYDDTLQNRFPEGKLFSNAILALSTIEFCNQNKEYDKKYAAIVDNCIRRIQSEKTSQIFNSNLSPKYGIFFNGWSNLVYSNYKSSPLFTFSELQINVKEASTIIEERINKTQTDSLRILDSYHEAKWPADNLIAITSMSNESLKKNWTKVLFEHSNHKSGLINHFDSDPSKIRGSSSAMITYCLGKSKFDNIKKYNELYKTIFIDEYLGVQLVKENEDGSNLMDVDSGPVVFGYGASATIMNIKTQASLGSNKSKITWALMNTIALPINIFNKKYYLMKKEPMYDLFMLWGSTEL